MAAPARVGHTFRDVRKLEKAIKKHEREATDAAKYLRGKLSEEDRTIHQSNLRNALANLSTAKWELQRQERGSDLDGLDTGHMSYPHTFHESAQHGMYTNVERGGLRLTEQMTIRLGQAYHRSRKEAPVQEVLSIAQVAALLHLTEAQVYWLITRSKRLRAHKLGGQWQIPATSLIDHARSAGLSAADIAILEQSVRATFPAQ